MLYDSILSYVGLNCFSFFFIWEVFTFTCLLICHWPKAEHATRWQIPVRCKCVTFSLNENYQNNDNTGVILVTPVSPGVTLKALRYASVASYNWWRCDWTIFTSGGVQSSGWNCEDTKQRARDALYYTCYVYIILYFQILFDVWSVYNGCTAVQ